MSELAKLETKNPDIKQKNSNIQMRKSKHPQSINTSADRILFLQRTIGNQAVLRLIESRTLQAKLKIGQPGDIYEQEADQMAERVMHMPEPQVQRQVEEEEELVQPKLTANAEYSIQRQVDEEEENEEDLIQTKPLVDQITPLIQRQVEEEKEEEILQTKDVSNPSPEVTPDIKSRIDALKGCGQPLPDSTRNYFEPRFGYDFSQVRIHLDSRAIEATRAVNAQAFTTGRDIVFGSGQYSPETATGKRLLAHELTHVVQQKQNLLNRKNKLDMIKNDYKREAVLVSTRIPYNHLNLGNELVTADTIRTGIRRTEDRNSLIKKYKETYNLVEKTRFELVSDPRGLVWLAFKVYRVKTGAWLSKIAMTEWGDPMLYKFLYSYDNEVGKAINSMDILGLKTVMESGDPNLIYPGQLFYSVFKNRDFTKPVDLNKLKDAICPLTEQDKERIIERVKRRREKFRICSRSLQNLFLGQVGNHAYIDALPNRYAIITRCKPTSGFFDNRLIATAAKKTNQSPDPCGKTPTCVECVPKTGVSDLASCLNKAFLAYSDPSLYKGLGPNSNTFAGTLARACCDNMKPKPRALGNVPGWDDKPAPGRAANCPSGPTTC